MIPVLIVHTNPTISTSIELMLEKYKAGVKKCLGYNRSEPIYYAQHQKPSIVFMESRYSIDETESVMYRFNYISPESKFYLLAPNLTEKYHLKNTINQSCEDIISECEIHNFIGLLLLKTYERLTQTSATTKSTAADKIKANLYKLTKTEKEIYLDIANGIPTKDIAVQRGIAIDTASKHIKHLLKKLDVHSRKDLLS